MKIEPLVISGKSFESRLFLGTGKFGSNELMHGAILSSGSQMVTMALKRVRLDGKRDDFLDYIKEAQHVQLLPNTSGAKKAKEAVFAAQLAREALGTNWVKLEIHPDPYHLLPDVVETLIATEELAKLGFIVLPYTIADPLTCKRLEDCGASAVMPVGSMIGSNMGLQMLEMLKIIIQNSRVPVVIDAGLGAPSHAAQAMEIGADAVLVNTAIAMAKNPTQMALAFKLGVEAGRIAYLAGLSKEKDSKSIAQSSSPMTSFLDEL